jgi:MFS family permease
LAEDLAVYCSRHPNVETVLRCNRCGVPICPRCAVLTEVGYRCPDCIRSQQSVFFNIRLSDYPVAALVSGSVAGLASLPLTRAGFFIAFLLSPVVGGLIGELVHRSVGRRRGRQMWLVVGSAVVVGVLLGSAISWLFLGPANPLAFVLYLVLCASTAAGRLR